MKRLVVVKFLYHNTIITHYCNLIFSKNKLNLKFNIVCKNSCFKKKKVFVGLCYF
jgi:hypothetical protein